MVNHGHKQEKEEKNGQKVEKNSQHSIHDSININRGAIRTNNNNSTQNIYFIYKNDGIHAAYIILIMKKQSGRNCIYI